MKMTLGELAGSGLISGNAAIAIAPRLQHQCAAGKTCEGCSCVHNKPLINIIRHSGKITRKTIIDAGGEKYLDREVVEVFAHKTNKLGIHIWS